MTKKVKMHAVTYQKLLFQILIYIHVHLNMPDVKFKISA